MVEVGELIVGVVEVGGDTTITIRPPEGETWLIFFLSATGDGTNSGGWYLNTDSAGGAWVLNADYSVGEGDANFCIQPRARFLIDYDCYLQGRNHAGITKILTYSGVRVK